VLSALYKDEEPKSVGAIIGEAKAMARPNIFADFLPERPSAPGWLREKCLAFNGVDVRVESARFIVSYNGLEVSLGLDTSEPEPNVLDGLTTPGEFFDFLMSNSQMELEG
jgi:hypothetical protein